MSKVSFPPLPRRSLFGEGRKPVDDGQGSELTKRQVEAKDRARDRLDRLLADPEINRVVSVKIAPVAEQADAPASSPGVERRAGSSPAGGTSRLVTKVYADADGLPLDEGVTFETVVHADDGVAFRSEPTPPEVLAAFGDAVMSGKLGEVTPTIDGRVEVRVGKGRPGRKAKIVGAVPVMVRMPAELLARLDAMRGDEGRPEAIRRILETVL